MNLFVQAALGLAVTLVVFLLLAIFAKKSKVLNIVMSVLVAGIIAAALVCSFMVQPESEGIMSQEETMDHLEIIYAMASTEDGMDQANKMLDELRRKAYDSPELTMCDAYLHAMDGDWRGAQVLYEKAAQMGGVKKDAKMEELFQKIAEESGAAYEESTGGGLLAAIEELQEHASDVVSEKADDAGEEVRAAVHVLSEAELIFDEYLQYNVPVQEEAEGLLEQMNAAIEDNEMLLQLEPVRNCRAKLMVLGEQYSELAQSLDENSTYEELAIVSELYLNGMIDEEDLPDEYTGDYRSQLNDVYDQLVEIQDKFQNEEDKKLIEELLEDLGRKIDSSTGLDILEDRIEDIACDATNSDSPKAYIQLAKISYSNGEDDEAQTRISSALNTVGLCEDEDFYVPMSEIAAVISDKESTQGLKDVAVYVDEVLNNTSDAVVVTAVQTANGELEEETEGFDSFVTDTVSKLRISINITKVDASDFSEVRATVNIDDALTVSAEELKEMISVTDCGAQITDFTVEKVEYKAANILLCCDVSGSMGGQPMEDLRNAVVTFVETSSDKEKIALVTFDDGVVDSYGFDTDKDLLIEKAEGLYDRGGTNMFGAVVDSLDMFSAREGELNFILLMSDGVDNTSRSEEEIMEQIGLPAQSKEVVMYSMGIGYDVDTDYMYSLARSTNGDFVYIADSAAMMDFYDTLRSQLLNQYIITFNAKDTMAINRTLEVFVTDDPLSRDEERYSLDGDDEDVTVDGEVIVSFGEKGIYGLDTSLVYKSSKPVTVKVRGFGFEEKDALSAKLDGKLNYGSENVKCEYVDANTLKLTIPGGIACGKYTVHVTVGGQTAVIADGITVVAQGTEKTTTFGPYVFTSYEKREEGGSIILSGAVNLNGWLHFRGDVTLTQTYSENEMVMTDYSGSYVEYFEDTAVGLAKMMAQSGIKLPVPALTQVTLVNEPLKNPESDDYPVNAVPVPLPFEAQLIDIEMPGISLYPNRLVLKSDEFTTKLPMQDDILKASGIKNLYNFKTSVSAVVSNKGIDIRGEFGNNPDQSNKETYYSCNFGKVALKFSPVKYTVKFDTIKNEYSMDFGVKLPFAKCEGFGLFVQWKARETDKGAQFLCPHEVTIKADVKMMTTIASVPVTFHDFKLGMSDIDPNKHILDWKLKGEFDLSTSKITEIIPGLEDDLGEPYLATLDDTTIELSLGQAYFNIDTSMKFLEKIELGSMKLEAGKINVTCALLGLESESATGMRAQLTKGYKWEADNCKFDVGGTGVLHLHDKFFGIEATGNAEVVIKWFIFKADFHAYGTGVIGCQFTNDLPTFVVKIAGDPGSGATGYFLSWNEKTNLEYGKIKL